MIGPKKIISMVTFEVKSEKFGKFQLIFDKRVESHRKSCHYYYKGI